MSPFTLQGIGKRLIWEVLKRQKRFSRFDHKVVHIILDDPESIVDTANGFALETLQVTGSDPVHVWPKSSEPTLRFWGWDAGEGLGIQVEESGSP